MKETCTICGCALNRDGEYATPTVAGRSHATKHHFVAERFFGRSTNRRGTQREPLFTECPWGLAGKSAVFCYECHEELLHNPVLLPDDLEGLSKLVKRRGFSESSKPEDRSRIGGRIQLFHEVIRRGIRELLSEKCSLTLDGPDARRLRNPLARAGHPCVRRPVEL